MTRLYRLLTKRPSLSCTPLQLSGNLVDINEDFLVRYLVLRHKRVMPLENIRRNSHMITDHREARQEMEGGANEVSTN